MPMEPTTEPKRRKRPYIPTGRPRGRPPKVVVREPTPAPPPPGPLAIPDPTVLYLRPEAAARAIGVSLSTMKKLVANGTVGSKSIGRMRLVELASLRTLRADH